MSTREIVTAQSGAWRYRGGGGITSESQSQSQSDGRQDGACLWLALRAAMTARTRWWVAGRRQTETGRAAGGRALAIDFSSAFCPRLSVKYKIRE